MQEDSIVTEDVPADLAQNHQRINSFDRIDDSSFSMTEFNNEEIEQADLNSGMVIIQHDSIKGTRQKDISKQID